MTWAWIITICGLCLWTALASLIVMTCRRVRSLQPGTVDHPQVVSVICPARNEADELESAMRTRLRDAAPWLEFILVNDRSTDETGPIMDRLASEDARIRVLHLEELPEGWLGKVHAQQQGIEIARGDWYLLSDADVQVDPGLIESALCWAQEEQADHVALIPRIIHGPVLLKSCLPVMMLVLMTALRLWRANDDRSDRAMGVGAFNLVRRAALEHAGGMEPLRMEIADDVGIGMIIHESGGRSRLAVAKDRLRVHWYRSTRDFLQGMEKGAAKGGGRIQLILHSILILVLVLALLSSFALLALWSVVPLPVSLIALISALVATATTLTASHRFGLPTAWACLVPLGLLSTLLVSQRSLWLAIIRGGVRWRGDQHNLTSTRAGERVRL